MTVLVTGGAGYIGSHTCVSLLNSGYDIAVLDNYSNSHPISLERVSEITGKTFPVYEADLLDRQRVDDVFQELDIDSVVHFAGFKAVGESVSNPLKYYHNNITGTLMLLETMQKHGVKQLVFSSSATVYGMNDNVPFSENLPFDTINPYGRTKMMLEMILADAVKADSNLSVSLLRYFNPVGAHESGRIGEDPSGIPNNLLPYVSQVAVGKLEQLTVHGNDYPTADGTCIRDYIHVMDLADGHVKALDYLKSKTGIEAFNLGTGQGSSVLDVVSAFEEAAGKKIPYKIGPRREGDSPVSYADPAKANEFLGWHATRNLVQMCADAWRWQSNNPHGYTHTAKVPSR